MTTSGFVAGTLVHTDKGLVPIEQLKVGDMVLSKHESGQGEQAYKRVVSTFKSAEKKRITYVKFFIVENGAATGDRYLFCTEDHPFWTMAYDDKENVQHLGWQPAFSLSAHESHKLEAYNNGDVYIDLVEEERGLWASKKFEIALTLCAPREDINGCIDFRGDRPTSIVKEEGLYSSVLHGKEFLHNSEPVLDLTYLPSDDADMNEIFRLIEEADGAYIPYMTTVYNIEVEDFHTYYVGSAGIWVHNSNGCFGVDALPLELRTRY